MCLFSVALSNDFLDEMETCARSSIVIVKGVELCCYVFK